MSKNYALFDWDNTTRKGYTLFSWINFLRVHEIISEECYHDIDNVRFQYSQGIISHDQYARLACKKYAKALQAVSTELIADALVGYMPYDRLCLLPNIGDIFDILNKNDIDIIVISGAPTIVIENYAKEFHFKKVFAFKEKTIDGIFTGEVEYNYGFDKNSLVNQIARSYGKRPLFAFGDSTSDIPMLEPALFPFCIGDGLKGFKNIHLTKRSRIPQTIVSEIRQIAKDKKR